MAADLAGTPRSGVTVQLCGDAHLSNFGLFGTPERRLLFDINDFDETLPGPWEWDVKRLAASFEVMGRDRGFSPADRRAIVMAGVREYRDRMRRAAGMGGLQAWYEHLEAGELLKLVRQEVAVKRVGKREARAHEDMVAKARSRDSTRVLAKRAGDVDGELRIVADPPIIVPIEDLVRPGHRRGRTPRPSSRSCSRPTGARSATTTTRSRSTGTCTRPGRSSASAASAPAATSCCWSAATTTTRCSSR